MGKSKTELMEHRKPTVNEKRVDRIQSEKTDHSNPEKFSLGQNQYKVIVFLAL